MVLIQHHVRVYSLGKASQVDASNFGVRVNATIKGPGGTAEVDGSLPGGDQIAMRDLLRVGNVDLDERTLASQLNNGHGAKGYTTPRFQGVTLLLDVHYSGQANDPTQRSYECALCPMLGRGRLFWPEHVPVPQHRSPLRTHLALWRPVRFADVVKSVQLEAKLQMEGWEPPSNASDGNSGRSRARLDMHGASHG